MKLLLFFLNILFCHFAFAQNDVRFTPVKDLSANDFPIIGKSTAVHFLKSSNGQCTSTTISQFGHQLTARHCLQHCLIRSKVFSLQKEQGTVDYFVRDEKALGSATCTVEIDGVEQDITIEATSPGLIAYLDRPSFASINKNKFQLLESQGYTSEGDFVIFKAKSSSASCLSLATNDDVSSTLQTIGYTTETNRPDGFNSNGIDMYFSQGRLTKGIAENQCVHDFAPSQIALDKLIKSFDQPTSFMSTLDANYGSSGTAVISVRAEVVGILIETHRHAELTKNPEDEPEQRYCAGSAKALRVSTIVKYVSADLIDQLHCE
jgi:hypothetical protein